MIKGKQYIYTRITEANFAIVMALFHTKTNTQINKFYYLLKFHHCCPHYFHLPQVYLLRQWGSLKDVYLIEHL